MSRKDSLRNRPRVLLCAIDEERVNSSIQMTNQPPTSVTASVFTSSRRVKNPNCSTLSETSAVTLDNPKRVLSNSTQDATKKLSLKIKQKDSINQDEICRQTIKASVTSPVVQPARYVTPPVTPVARDGSLEEISVSDMGLVTQHPTPSKWGSLMPDFTASQTDDISCDVMWDCSSPDAIRHLRKMRRNNSNHVKEIVKHVKDNLVKGPPTPPLLSVVLESRSLHIQKQEHQQHRHLTRQERLERRRVNKSQQVRHDAQALLEKILSAVEKQKCSEENLQPAPQSDDIPLEPRGDPVLSSAVSLIDDEGNKTEEDTWGDDSLFEEDSFIIQVTQNPELFIDTLTHSASSSAQEKQDAGVTEYVQPFIQMVELCCSTTDSGNLSVIAPTLADAKPEHLRALCSVHKEGSVGTREEMRGETASLEVSPAKISVSCGVSSRDLLESLKFRSALEAVPLRKPGQKYLRESVEAGASVSCVAQLFGQSSMAAGETEQGEGKKGVPSVKEAGVSVHSSQENKAEVRPGLSETSECDPGSLNEAGTENILCGMDAGEQTFVHPAGRDPAQKCRRDALQVQSVPVPSMWKDGICCPQDSGKRVAGADRDPNGEVMDTSLPEEMLLQIIEADDTLDSQIIQEYPTQLPNQTLVRPAAFGNEDGFDDLNNECLESISQFESFEVLPQRGRQVENRKECVVHVPEDHWKDSSAMHSRGPHGPSECKHPKLGMKQSCENVPLLSFVTYGSKKSALPFKRSVPFERSRDGFEKSKSCNQTIIKPIRNCMKITNDEENTAVISKMTNDCWSYWNNTGLYKGPLGTLAQGNSVLDLETRVRKTGVSNCAGTGKIPAHFGAPLRATSLLGKKPRAAARLTTKVPAFHPEACLKEETWDFSKDTMEFADEALFESQILALLDEVESQASQQNVILASQESVSQDRSQLSSFSSRKCSQEEIEKKRQAALMRRKSSSARVPGNIC